MRFVSFSLLILGEALSVLTEMYAARRHDSVNFWTNWGQAAPVIAVAGGFLIAGYIVGYSAFRNIWTVSAISITSILLVEPAVAYAVFRELPNKGATIGLCLGAAGLIVTLFVR